MKFFGLTAFVLSVALVGAGCDDDPEVILADGGGNMAVDGGADLAPASDAKP